LLFLAVVLGTQHWIITLQRTSREEIDPEGRRRWWLRAFFLLLNDVLWYQDHRRTTTPLAGSDTWPLRHVNVGTRPASARHLFWGLTNVRRRRE